jgi:catechol 2,3-dioxygenase
MKTTEFTALNQPVHSLPDAAKVGRVRLAISDLNRSVSFYSDVLGLSVLSREEQSAALGTPDGTVLLELEETPGVKPLGARPRLGLYHTAFLLPNRATLSSFVDHLNSRASDHSVSEAIYLVDPDGLTVEVYADRDRTEWRSNNGQLIMGSEPIDFGALAAVQHDRWTQAPTGTRVGHVHFYVGDLPAAANFYNAALGMDIMSQMPGALFVAAGGYHHHVGLNTWAAGSPPASQNDARILLWELVLPDEEEIDRLAASMRKLGWSGSAEHVFTDPWGINVAFVTEPLLPPPSTFPC